MKNLFSFGLCMCIMSAISGCSKSDPNEKLLRLVKDTEFSVPIVLMEMRGNFYTSQWFEVTLYFGYGADGNFEACRSEADRLNRDNNEIKYRCRLIN